MSWWDCPANPCGPYTLIRESTDPDRAYRAPESLRRSSPFLAEAVDLYEQATARPWSFTERPHGIEERARAEWEALKRPARTIATDARLCALADQAAASAPIKERHIHRAHRTPVRSQTRTHSRSGGVERSR